MHPFLFQIGGFKLPMYGLMIATGYLLALFYIFKKNKAAGLNKENLSDLLFYLLLMGIIGGKLFYVLTYWGQLGGTFGARLGFVIRNFQYGFVFYGGFLLAMATFFIFSKKKKLPMIPTAELITASLPLAHAFGRIGCFFAGCCYGRPTDSVFGVIFDNPQGEVPAYLMGRPIHPVQLYEAFGNLIIFAILNVILSRELREGRLRGRVFCSYMLMYGVLRFSLEFFRGDDRGTGLFALSPAQTISIFLIMAAAAGFFLLKKSKKI